MTTTGAALDRPSRCGVCREPIDSPIGCLQCHTIFPPSSELTHFDRLGLPVKFDIADEALERAYLAWSRELHPDFFHGRDAAAQSLSLKLSASLNDAYATLRDPVRRAEYLLLLRGGPMASVHRAMPEGFLEDVLELRGEIEEARESGAAGNAGLEEIRERIARDRRNAMQRVAERFRAMEKSTLAPAEEELRSIREELNTVKYYDGLLREVGIAD